MDLGLAGRVGVLTGADGAVGMATARLLRGEGVKVLMVGRDAAALADAAEGLDGGDEEIATLPLDPTEPDAGEQMLGAASEEFGGLDFLVNFAGAPGDPPADDLRAACELGVMAPLRAMKTIAPALAERGQGRIVNVCPPPRSVAGAAALALSRLFAERYGKQRVLVNSICPGPDADPAASAREIAFLCSERASHVAGATWTVGATDPAGVIG